VNCARRQQYRRLSLAGKAALVSVVAALLGLVGASAGAPALAGLLLLTAVGLGLYARHGELLHGGDRVDLHRVLERGGGAAQLRACRPPRGV
jgi:hypothetical protein